MPRLLSALSLALSAFLPLNPQSKERVLDEGVRHFIQSYCIKCHGPDEEKGDRAFHELALKKNDEWVVNLADPKKTDLLHDVLDQLNLGEMPPKKKSQPASPDHAAIAAFVEAVARGVQHCRRITLAKVRCRVF